MTKYLVLAKCKKCERMDFYYNSYAPIWHAMRAHPNWHLGKSIEQMFKNIQVWK